MLLALIIVLVMTHTGQKSLGTFPMVLQAHVHGLPRRALPADALPRDNPLLQERVLCRTYPGTCAPSVRTDSQNLLSETTFADGGSENQVIIIVLLIERTKRFQRGFRTNNTT